MRKLLYWELSLFHLYIKKGTTLSSNYIQVKILKLILLNLTYFSYNAQFDFLLFPVSQGESLAGVNANYLVGGGGGGCRDLLGAASRIRALDFLCAASLTASASAAFLFL